MRETRRFIQLFSYDEEGRCVSSSGKDNTGRINLVFYPALKKTVLTDSRGNRSEQYYNDDYLVTKTVNPRQRGTQRGTLPKGTG